METRTYARLERLEMRTLLSSTSATIDLNGADDVGANYTTTFTEGAGPILVQDVDLEIGAGPIQLGAEFRVNTTTAGGQSFGLSGGNTIATDAAGNFVVTWSSPTQDGSGDGVYAQRYNAAGSAVGGEFRVNTFTSGNQRDPSVAMNATGDFVVAWSSVNQDGSGDGIYAQRYNAAGATVGGEFQVSTFSSDDQTYSSVAMDDAGNVIITWTSRNQDGSSYGVYGQRYDATGAAVGGEFQINTYSSSHQTYPSVAMADGGNFVVTWSSHSQDGSGYGVYGQRHNAAGSAMGAEFQINTYTSGDQIYPSVAMGAAGNFVVTWSSVNQDGSGFGVYGQRYNTAGSPVGSEFRVNTSTADYQRFPSVAMDASGNFVVTWQSFNQDGSDYGVYGQRYDASGLTVGREFRINTFTSFNQIYPSVAMDALGNFVVTWQSFSQDGSGDGIFAQQFQRISGPFEGASVTIANLLDGAAELLTVDTTGTAITASYAAGVLTLSGTDTVEAYERVLRTITYENSSEDPDTTNRTIMFVVELGGMSSEPAVTTVSVVAVNDPPTVSVEQSTVSVSEGFLATNTGTHSDADSTLTLSASIGTVVDIGDGTWNWSFDTSDGPDESQTVTITAIDSDGAQTSTTFALTVENIVPSVAADNAATTVEEGATAGNSGTVSDPGADTVSLSASVGTVVDNGNGTWSWSFDTSDGPDESQTVTITATDSDGAQTMTSFQLTVNNVPPLLTADNAEVVVSEGETATNTGTQGDLGADAVFLTASIGSLLHHGNGTWSWSFDTSDGPDESQLVTITATDSDGAKTTTTFALTVQNVAPSVAADNAVVTVNEGATAANSGTVSDPGADTVSLSASVGTVVDNGDGTWSWSFDTSNGPQDSQQVEITVFDDIFGPVTETFTLAVANVAPAIEKLTVSSTTINEFGTVTVSGEVFDPGLADSQTASIDWGDGTPQTALNLAPVTVELTAASEIAGVDSNGNGVFSQLSPDAGETLVISKPTPIQEQRVALEFDLSEYSPGTILGEAILRLFELGTSPFSATLEVHGYSGTGNATLPDLQAYHLLETRTIGPSTNQVDFNLTEFVQSVINAGGTHAGVVFRVANLNETFVIGESSHSSPSLRPQFRIAEALRKTFTASHFYSDDNPTSTPSDTYTINVHVSDSDGALSTLSSGITVNNVAPVLPSLPAEDLAGFEYALLSREITFQEPNFNDSLVAYIDYGDGSAVQQVNLAQFQRSLLLEHFYDVTPGQTSQHTVTVDVVDDDSGVGSTSFIVHVADRGLTEPDLRPTINFQQSNYTISENSRTYQQIIATLSSPAQERLEVSATLTDITATRDEDYVLSDSVFVFNTGATSASVTLLVKDDAIFEPGGEASTLTFGPKVTGVKLGGVTTTTLGIIDNDLPPEVFFQKWSNNLEEGDHYELSVELAHAVGIDLTVPIMASGATSDVFMSSHEIVIPAGSQTGSLRVWVRDDPDSEPSESVYFGFGPLPALVRPSTSSYRPRSHTLSIAPSDSLLASLALETSTGSRNVTKSEADGFIDVFVTLDDVTSTDVTIPLLFSSTTAESPYDYTVNSSVTIPAGFASAATRVAIVNDNISESTEQFEVRFGQVLPDGIQLGLYKYASVTIEDDDAARIAFTTSSQSVFEDEGNRTFTVTTGGVPFDRDVEIPITVTTSSGAAVFNGSNADLTGPGSKLVLPQGATTATFTLDPIDDSHNEPTESFVFTIGDLSEIPGAVLGAKPTHKVTLKDEDPLVSIKVSTTSVSEGTTNVTFTVQLSAATNKTVRIPFSVYGTADRGDDYTINTTTTSQYKVATNYVDIYRDNRSAVISVTVKEDSIIEGSETVGIKLRDQYASSTLTNATLNPSKTTASFKINNDDGVPTPRISAVRSKSSGSSSYSSTSTYVNEGGSFKITVSIPKAADKNIWIPITFPTGSGRASSSDFTTSGLNSGKLKIAAGKTSAVFYVHTVNDTRTENTEKIRVTLGQPVDINGNKFGKLGSPSYKDVYINPSDQPAASAGTLAIGGTLPSLGSTTGSSSTPVNLASPTIGFGTIAIASAGYLNGNFVFLDGNLNGIRDFVDFDGDGIQSIDEPDEPLVTTFPDGSFLIDVPVEFDRNGNGLLDIGEGQFVGVGGTDTSTGLPQVTSLVAAPGDYMLTALTTLAAELVNNQGYSLSDAHDRVLDGLGLAPFEFGRIPALHAIIAGDPLAAESYPATVALDNAAVVIASYLNAVTQVDVNLLGTLVYEEISTVLAQVESRVDLSSPAFLDHVIFSVAYQLGYPSATGASATVADRLAAINAEILELPVSADLPFLDAVIKRKIVARGEMATDAAAVGAGTLSETDFAARFSSQSLENQVDQAESQVIVPVGIAVSDAAIVEGDDGTTYAEFQVAISSHFSEPVSVVYSTSDDTAVDENAGSEADYGSVSGTLTWNVGDDLVKTIQVPVHGDLNPEADETFLLELSSATGGLVQRAIGYGFIRANDAITIDLNGDVDGSEVTIEIDGDFLSVYQNGEARFDDLLSPLVPLEIRSASDGPTQFLVSVISPTESGREILLTSNHPDDVLHFSNPTADVSERLLLDAATGQFVAEGLKVNYQGFGAATDEHSPTLTITTSQELNQTVTAEGVLPDSIAAEADVLSWTVRRDGTVFATETGLSVEFVPAEFGDYEVEFRVELLDGSVGIVRTTFSLGNPLPVGTIDSISELHEEGTPIQVTGSGTDSNSDASLLTLQWRIAKTMADGTVDPDFATGDGETFLFTPDNDGVYEIFLTVTDPEGGSSTVSENIQVTNVAPTVSAPSFYLAENSPNGTPLGFVPASDPGDDTLTFSITGGSGATAFFIDAATGEITVADTSQLDFETTPSFTLEVMITDDEGASDTAQIAIDLLNQASLTGTVFVDVDQDGLYDANEVGLDGVTIELLDDQGTVVATTTTSDGGLYLFEDLEPGVYRVRELQPSGVTDGAEQLGSLGGIVVGNDLMQLTLQRTDASDYTFAEIGQAVSSGDSAGIGFWQNKHGQELIKLGGTALADWLTANFANVFGDELAGADGASVAAFYKDQLFKQKAQKSAGPAKVDAQFMAVAFATFFTSQNLAGNVAISYGFNVTDTGIGTKVVNVGNSGAAFGVPDHSDRTILQLLLATNSLTDLPDEQSGFAYIYDQNGDGLVDSGEAALRTMANEIYSLINEQGDI